jgi:MFS transporter, FSR family, fosmidomycin resistance protein
VLYSAVLLSLLAVVPSVPLLFVLVAVAGLGSAAIHPAGSMLVRQGTSRPEFAVALFAAGGMLGYGPYIASRYCQSRGKCHDCQHTRSQIR